MSFGKPSNIKDLLLHLGAIIGLLVAIILIIFYVWLPSITNHGETITVPDVEGMSFDLLDDFLINRNLRYEVSEDSGYTADLEPFAIISQFPKPNSRVKENRKIYLTLNSKNPPLVKMPKLEDLSLKAAQLVLKSYELKLGEITYVPDPITFGTIHEAMIDGRTVLEGESIPKGSVIDLIAGDGYGNQFFESPQLIGLSVEEAETVIIGSGLKVRNKYFTKDSQAIIDDIDEEGNDIKSFQEVGPGEIQKQMPAAGTTLKINDVIDLWIYQPDSINYNSTILNDN